VPVPDERLGKLAELYQTRKVVPATVTFVDIAGLVAGASQGEGLGNQFLAHIRSCNAILQVVRAFQNGDVLRSDSSRDPAHDIEVINTELVLADLQTVEKRLPRLDKEVRGNPKLKPMADTLQAVKQQLDDSKPLWQNDQLLADYTEHLTDLQLLTAKPIMYLFNVDEETLQDTAKQAELQQLVGDAPAVFVCATLEDELRGLDPSEQREMLETYGQTSPGLDQVIHAAYEPARPPELPHCWRSKKSAPGPSPRAPPHLKPPASSTAISSRASSPHRSSAIPISSPPAPSRPPSQPAKSAPRARHTSCRPTTSSNSASTCSNSLQRTVDR
jgi:GTP-binding protein YchF